MSIIVALRSTHTQYTNVRAGSMLLSIVRAGFLASVHLNWQVCYGSGFCTDRFAVGVLTYATIYGVLGAQADIHCSLPVYSLRASTRRSGFRPGPFWTGSS
jgi:hypothetical protein